MKIIYLLFGLILYIETFGQEFKTIKVLLKNVIESQPFYPNQTSTKISGNSIGFEGIPLDVRDFKIKELVLRPGSEKLFIFYGLTTANKRIIIFDSNFDKDFSKETEYLFDNDITYDKQKAKAVVNTTSSTEIKFPNAPSIFIKPDIFNCCMNYTNPADSIWHLFVKTDYHREGTFEINSKRFKIALSGSYSPYYTMNRTNVYLISDKQLFEGQQSNKNQPYQLKQSIFNEKQEFSIDSINKFGDTAWVIYKGYYRKPTGNRQGLFAQNILAISLDKNLFNLYGLKGKYVLLDFWGTWCNPCIELIPKLKALNEKYNSKGLFLVSIAYDDKNSYKKLIAMIKEKQMNWTHIYDNRDVKDNICDQYDIQCFPTSIFIDANGKILFRACGEEEFATLEKLIDKKLE